MPNFIRMVQKYGQSMCYVVKYISTKSIYQKKNSCVLLRINKKNINLYLYYSYNCGNFCVVQGLNGNMVKYKTFCDGIA